MKKLGLPGRGKKQLPTELIQEERQGILSDSSDFFVREAYKALRTNVTFSLAGVEGCKVVVVTSSLPQEGKSTTAVNLALSFAETNQRVLIIDCDMRKPKLGRLLNIKAPVGLSNLLLKPALLEDTAVIKPYDTIDVILAGVIPPNPSELLGSPQMTKLLNALKQHYDYIILDTPPVNLVTDAVVLGPQSHGVLFVVRANQSERGDVSRALKELRYSKVKMLGFALNGVEISKSGGYGGKRYKRYQGYEAYGYGDQTPTKTEGEAL